MKKIYTAPLMQVVNVQAEEFMAQSPGLSGNPANGSAPLIKGEINTGIDFDDMTGTEIIRKNPWDSQW